MRQKVKPLEITWQEARDALIAIDFFSLCDVGGAEHFVRDNKRVILYPDCEDDIACKNLPTDLTKLQGSKYVVFTRDGDDITAHV